MSKPIRCATCGRLVGVHSAFGFHTRQWHGKCPGYARHPIKRTEEENIYRPFFLGYPIIYYTITKVYGDTHIVSEWNEYRGDDKDEINVLIKRFGKIYCAKEGKWHLRPLK